MLRKKIVGKKVMKIKKTILLIISAWVILIVISFLWNYTNVGKEQERIALHSARSFFDHIVITRLWNARHGGLYAPVTEKMLPNPYLDVPMRDIQINDKLKLTKVNPAYMTRQISEIAMEQKGVQFHITSLKPIRPQNKPTAREEKFLKEFEKGIKEKGMFIKKGVKYSYFYMAPLITKKACLRCHAKQGYNDGDVRGGISVTLPFIMKIPFLSLLLGHIVIGLVGLLGIIIAGGRLNKAYETTKKQALFDALTGIPNRRHFSESILREFRLSQRSGQPLSMIICDIDNFKAYNDTYGHSKGDLCLTKVAQTIKTSLKRPSDFCARYGGEEFVILLPNTPLDGAKHIAEKIRSNIEKMGIPHKNSLPTQVVTLSLGVTTSEGTILVSHEELIKRADMVLFKAKEQGRNQVQSFSVR
ncbi:MAG: diguanylate cyclase [Deltaproteobacteria bacterium]|nr:diguanylate cyclase [Deltaproteobacteria bacterium]